jgi:hypothetical protein
LTPSRWFSPTPGQPSSSAKFAAVNFVPDAFNHLKIIGHVAATEPLLRKAGVEKAADEGVVALGGVRSVASFVAALKKMRVWEREKEGPHRAVTEQLGASGAWRLSTCNPDDGFSRSGRASNNRHAQPRSAGYQTGSPAVADWWACPSSLCSLVGSFWLLETNVPDVIDFNGAAGGYRTYDLSLTKGVLYH